MGKEGDSDSGDEFCQNINAPTSMPCDKCDEAGPAGCVKCKKTGIVEADDLSPRYKRAISIILDAEPDLVSVQECDRAEQFTTFMQDAGYGVYFNKKTASATTRVGVGMDCVGIFYNKRTFEKVYGPRKIFLPNVKKGSSSTVGKQAAMWLLLRRRETGRPVAVVTAHLKSGKEAGEDGLIKQVQAARMAEILKKELGRNVPIIFGCDFNNGTETKSYDSFRREVPFMAEAYEDVYGRSPLWGSSKWRSGGGQTHKIGHTPNNIDFIFYTRQFFNTLSVLAYPEEDLETCNLPGWRYPSDHFAHMATFEERDDGDEASALAEELFHLLIRENAIPSTNTIIRDRVDYTYKTDKTCLPLAPEEITRENMVAVIKKCRPFYTDCIPRCGECNGTGTRWDTAEASGWSVKKSSNQCAKCHGSGLPAVEILFKKLKKAYEADQGATYIKCVKAQANKMNAHNKRRTPIEEDGEKYRTYTIIKALYSLKKAGCGYNEIDDIDNAKTTDILKFIEDKDYFKKLPEEMEKYQKLFELPITEEELVKYLPIYQGKLPDNNERNTLEKKKWFNPDTTTQGRRLGDVNTKGMSPSELALHRRRLADAARMEEKDVDAMSPSQLALHRRRLTHGARVSPVLAALMDEIEQAQRNY